MSSLPDQLREMYPGIYVGNKLSKFLYIRSDSNYYYQSFTIKNPQSMFEECSLMTWVFPIISSDCKEIIFFERSENKLIKLFKFNKKDLKMIKAMIDIYNYLKRIFFHDEEAKWREMIDRWMTVWINDMMERNK